MLLLSWLRCLLLAMAVFFATSSAAARSQTITVVGKKFLAIEVNPKQLSLHWKNRDDTPYKYFSSLKKSFKKQGKKVIALMNAGIYSKSYQPAGLHVETGKVIQPLNTNKGRGNFHLQPNGVFLIRKGKPGMVTTGAYKKYFRGKESQMTLATQSGPMLLIDGKINRQFLPNSQSQYTRNGVCTTQSGKLYFIATDGFPSVSSNFYQFAKAAEAFGCYNALYLDGSISKLYLSGENTLFHFAQFVGILAVTQP